MSDEGFHEIQLNGKQLVFLFMAATVVSVVIFLLGVMVGRGVRSPRGADAQIAESTASDPTAVVQTSSGSPSIASDRTPVSAQESLTYAERLSAPTPAPDTLTEPSPAPAEVPPPVVSEPPPSSVTDAPAPRVPSEPAPPAKQPAVVTAAAPPAAPATQATTLAEPPGNGLVVQVGAYPRSTAETIARQLAAKGYPAFVTPRPQGLFAVRVGKYTDPREAEAVSLRLEQEEQFNKPWVTR